MLAKIKENIDALNLGASYEVTKVSYTEAIAGALSGDTGTNGSYKFIVKLTKGSASTTTAEKILTITATSGA